MADPLGARLVCFRFRYGKGLGSENYDRLKPDPTELCHKPTSWVPWSIFDIVPIWRIAPLVTIKNRCGRQWREWFCYVAIETIGALVLYRLCIDYV